MSTIIDWLEEHTVPCLYKKFLGVECPGCGMQTSLIELLKGNVIESIKLFPPLLPIIFLIPVLVSIVYRFGLFLEKP